MPLKKVLQCSSTSFLIMKTQFQAFGGEGLVEFQLDESTANIRYGSDDSSKTYTYNVPNMDETLSEFNRVSDEGGSIGNFVAQCRKNQSLVEVAS